MDVAVCLKWVDRRPEIDPLTGEVATDDRWRGASPADEAALEWGLRIAERMGATVTAVSAGPAAADTMLLAAVATGASQAIRIDGAHSDEPSEAVADMLAAVCAEAQLVCCGVHSVDRGSGAVPAFLAAKLGIPQALGLVTVTSIGESGAEEGAGVDLVVERRADLGRRQRLGVTGRCVLSFEGGVELRRASLRSTLAAREAAIEVVAASRPTVVAQPSTVASGPYRPRTKVVAPPEGPTADRIATLLGSGQGSGNASQVHEVEPDEAARIAVERLTEWGYLAGDGDGDERPIA